ncbi:MAG: glycosyltransferase [Ilumatobacteraceae bacterium]
MVPVTDPDVSVIVPASEAERYIAASLASIRDSRCAGIRFEVVVVDAGSNDATPEIVEAIGRSDHRFRLLRSDRRLTAPEARNVALTTVRAPIVACLDHDDETLPDRLTRHVGVLTAEPGIAAVGGALTAVDTIGVSLGDGPTTTTDLGIDASRYVLPFHCPTLTSAMTYRVSALRAVGGFVEDRPYADDYHLFAALFDHGGVRILAEPAARYRHHPDQLSIERRPEQQLEVTLLRQRLAAAVLGSPPPIGVVWAWKHPSNADRPTRELAVEFLDRYHVGFLDRYSPAGDDLERIVDLHLRRREMILAENDSGRAAYSRPGEDPTVERSR